MKLENFYKKYNNHQMEDWGSVMSEEYKVFQRNQKSVIKGICEEIGANLVRCLNGHYFESYSVEKDGKYVYICENMLDRCNKNFDLFSAYLIRTQINPDDHTGGPNHYTSLFELKKSIKFLLKIH